MPDRDPPAPLTLTDADVLALGEQRAIVFDDVLGSARADAIRRDALTLFESGALRPAGIGRSATHTPEVRADHIRWLDPAYVASQLGASAGGGNRAATPGTHGHSLDSVSAGGTELSASGPNTVPASPAPTFTVNFTNGGQSDETNVVVKVSVEGAGKPIEGTQTVPKTTAGQSATAQVRLPSSPPTGQELTVKATVEPVPGETNTDNNTQSYPVTFS